MRRFVVLPNGKKVIEVEHHTAGGSETQVLYDYYEIIYVPTDPLALGIKIDVNIFERDWNFKVINLLEYKK